MTDKPKANGFGSFEKYLIFSVPKQYAASLTRAGWDIFHEGVIGTQFKFIFSSRSQGDDETALFELMHDLPDNYEGEGLRVLWERSVY